MIDNILFALWMTIELWVFLAILMVALFAEEIIKEKRSKLVDNPALR